MKEKYYNNSWSFQLLCFNIWSRFLVQDALGGFKMRNRFYLGIWLSFFISLFFVLGCTSFKSSQMKGESKKGDRSDREAKTAKVLDRTLDAAVKVPESLLRSFVKIKAGEFKMGSSENEEGHYKDERQPERVYSYISGF